MCWFPTPSINKFDMGNNSSEGIPRIISKNWVAVTELPNTYRKRLTGQFAHKHIVVWWRMDISFHHFGSA